MPDTASTLFRRVRQLLTSPPTGEAPDHELLQRFVSERQEEAFSVLVRRHGPMVLGVCRRLLRDEHDAEDAFQATFLALASGAASIRRAESVRGWLYGVAYRLALRLRRAAARRTAAEAKQKSPSPANPLDELSARELLALLDDALHELPKKYFTPLLLCYLEGQTQEEAARELGWPRGTLKSRLERGRELLHERLARRGVLLSAALVPAVLTRQVHAAVPPLLEKMTAHAAVAFATGQLPATASSAALALASGAQRSPLSARWAVALFLTGILVVGQQLAAVGDRPPADGPQPALVAKPAASTRKLPADPLPEGAVARLGSVRFRDPAAHISATAFAPDGKSLAAIDLEGSISLWNMDTGKVVRRLAPRLEQGTEHPARDVHAFLAFSPDGKRVLAGLNRGCFCRPLFLWDVATGKEICRMEGAPDGFVAAAVSPNFKMLAAASRDGHITLWEPATGKRLQRWQGPAGSVEALAFSPDGKTLALGGGDKLVRLWEVASGRERLQLRGHEAGVAALAFSPDGRTLASAERDRRFILWDVARGRPRQRWTAEPDDDKDPSDSRIFALAFAPDGRTLASGDRYRGLALWSVPSGKRLHQMRGEFTHLPTFAPDGGTVAVGGAGMIFLWDVATGRPVYPDHDGRPGHLGFTPDSRTVYTAGYHRIDRWDATTGEHFGTLQMGYAPILAGGGLAVDRAGGLNRLRVWDVAAGRVLRTIESRRSPALQQALSPDGRTLAVSSGYGEATLALFDAVTGKELHCLGTCGAFVSAADFSSDGRLLAVVDGTGRAGGQGADAPRCRLWDVRSGALVRQFTVTDSCRTAVFSPDGRYLATCGWTRTIRLWETLTGQEVRSWSGVRSTVNHVAWSPDGRTLASAERDGVTVDNCSVHLWDVESGKELAAFKGHGAGEICSLAFFPDGKRLVSGSSTDGTALVWDVARYTGRARATAGRLRPHELRRMWSDLASHDAGAANKAIQSLARAPRDAVAHLAEQLPQRPEVIPVFDGKRVARLIADLDDARFAVREKATAELIRFGPAVAPGLREHLRGERVSAEVRRRIEQVLKVVDHGNGVSPVLARWLRAVEVLECIGTPEAREVLKSLTDARTQDELVREARAALKRLR